MIVLTPANQEDLLTIAKLAYSIWNEHYVTIIGQSQVDYMLDKFYNQQSLQDQVNVQNHVFFLIKINQINVGFVSVSTDNSIDFIIHKFYISQQTANKGIGTQVLQLLINLLNPKTLTLTVNRQNFKSINFYFKNGFKIKSVKDFDIGHDYKMNDFIMFKTIC